jgi:uncharacterized protein
LSYIGPTELIIFQSTPFCNLDCKYCYLPDRNDKSKINFDLIELSLKKLVEERLIEEKISILWHAGEPMVLPIEFYNEINKIILKIIPSEIEVTQHFQTNATLINDEWCEFFKTNNIEVGISLDGPKHVNDRKRVLRNGKGTFEQVMKGVKLLKKHKIEFSAIAVLTDYSLDFTDEIYDFFKDLGVKSLGFNIDEVDGMNKESSLTGVSLERMKEFWRRIYQLQLIPENYIRIREIHGFNEALLKSDLASEEHHFGQMTFPMRILTIDTNGNFTTFSPELLGITHLKFGDFNFGNVYNSSFRDIQKNSKFNQINEEIYKGVKNCKKECEYFGFCGGGAPSNKLAENDSFDSTLTKYCQYNLISLVDACLEEIETNLN